MTSIIKKIFITIIFILCITGYNRVFVSVNTHKEVNVKITQYQDKDLFATSIEISKRNYKKAQSVILMSNENYMDLICALPLSKKINAPILIYNDKNFNVELYKEIQRLGAKKVFLIGGQAKILQQYLKNLKLNIIQISGKNIYETSYNIAKQINFREAIVINGESYIDAMSIVPIAAKRQMPIILVEGDSLPKQYNNLFKSKKVNNIYIIGDKDSVSYKIDRNFKKVVRIFGRDRYDTNLKILMHFNKYIDFSKIVLYDPQMLNGYNNIDTKVSIYAVQNDSFILFNNNSNLGIGAKYVKEGIRNNIELIHFENNISADMLNAYKFYLSNKINYKIINDLENNKKCILKKRILDKDLKLINSDEILNKKIYYTNRALVLMYHHIDEENYSSITITPERFESDLKMLKDKGFNVVSLRYLLLAIDGQAKLPPNAVVITFDDGLESFYTYAYPLLEKYEMPAINFVITKRIDYKPENSKLEFMNRTQLKEMLQSGLIDIQSHTHDSHEYIFANRNLDKIGKIASPIYYVGRDEFESQAEYENRVRVDLSKSFEVLKEILGEEPYVLSFPFGHYNDKVVKIAKEVGFSYFVTIKKDVNLQDSRDAFIYRINAGINTIDEDKLFNIMIELIKEKNKRTSKFIEIEG